MMSHGSRQNWWPLFNVTDPGSVSIAEYREWYSHYSSAVGPNVTDCSLEEEMNKVILRYNYIYLYLCRGCQDKVLTCLTNS